MGALRQTSGLAVINEPDNEWPNLFALKAKLRLGRFPVLESGDMVPREYEDLWKRTFAGLGHGKAWERLAWKLDRGERTMRDLWLAMCEPRQPRLSFPLRLLAWGARPPSTRQPGDVVVVKSVHAPLALDWIHARFHPRIVAVLRHPLNVISSWMQLGWGGCALHQSPRVLERFETRWGLPKLTEASSPLQRVAWEVGLISSALEEGVGRHPDWVVASHEQLCLDPEASFRRLYEQLGFLWSDQVSRYLTSSNRPGTGFEVLRVAAEQPLSWKKRLTPEQLTTVWSVLSGFKAPWVSQVAGDLAQ